MKYEEIIKLLDAGYSREEILNMKEQPPKEQTPEEQPPEEQPDPSADALREMKEMFAEMKKEITAMNIMNAVRPGDEEKTSEDIIANIINPTKKDKKEGN